MKKRIIEVCILLICMAGLIFFSGENVRSDDAIKHFTAFFAVEGDTLDSNNEIRQKIAQLTGADCEEIWLVGQTKESALNSYIVSGEYPDFISGDISLYEANALIPLDEYWDDYPNSTTTFTSRRATRSASRRAKPSRSRTARGAPWTANRSRSPIDERGAHRKRSLRMRCPSP